MAYNPYGNHPYAQPNYAGPSYPTASTSGVPMNAAYQAAPIATASGYTPYPSVVAAGPVYPGTMMMHHQSPAGPFLPGASSSSSLSYDSELAQQQSVYTPEGAQRAAANAKANQQRRVKSVGRTTVLRKGGGQVWEDQSLLEWDPGDLDPSLSEDQLREAFSGNGRYPSFVKSKIIRDKKTNKGKGFGFVSYSDPEDFLKAWKELNGKYVGTRPVKISRASGGVAAVQIGAKKAATFDAKKLPKSGTVPFERAKLVEAEGGHMNKNSNGFGPQRAGKSYIRR